MRYLASSVPSGGVLALASSIFRRGQTGTLELETEQGQRKLYFVEGQLYLRRSLVPLAAKIGDHLAGQHWQGMTQPDVVLRELLQLTAEHVGKWKVTSYRFLEGFQVDADELTGPLPTGLLDMEALPLDKEEESARVTLMGGLDATVEQATTQDPSVVDLLKPQEVALLGHLKGPSRIGDLLGGSEIQSRQTISALFRLWVLGLVQEAGQSEDPVWRGNSNAVGGMAAAEHRPQALEENVESGRLVQDRKAVSPSGDVADSLLRESAEVPKPIEPKTVPEDVEYKSNRENLVVETPVPEQRTVEQRRDAEGEQPVDSDGVEHLRQEQSGIAEPAALPWQSEETANEFKDNRRGDVDVRIWNHFGLKCDPFSLTPDPRFVFLSESHSEALAGIKLSLLERRGLCVMTGEVGTGKTTLLYSMLSSLGTEFETAYVHNPALPFDQLLEHILDDFGISVPPRCRRVDLLGKLNEFLIRCSDERKIATLIIDEAQNLSDATFEAIRLLLNFETFDSKLLQIVLVGQPELGERLRSTALRQIKDRVAIRCRLEPLSPAEARSYIANRIESAGGAPDTFSRSAVGMAARKARYIPRRINVICHNALLYAYGKGQEKVKRSQVAEAVRDLKR